MRRIFISRSHNGASVSRTLLRHRACGLRSADPSWECVWR
jgi:hypothetical protein